MEDVPPPSPPTWATDPLGTIHARIRTAFQAVTGGSSRPIPNLGALTKDLPPTASLPLLTPTTTPGSLIRLTGMVQDMADPDLWYTRYGPAPGRTTWGVEEVDADTSALLQAESESGGGVLAQRVGVRLVTPPGMTEWARRAGGGGVLMGVAAPSVAPRDGAAEGEDARGGKRKLDDDAAAVAMDDEAPSAAAMGGPEKRFRDATCGGGTAGGTAAAAAGAAALLFPGEELDDVEAASTLGLNLPVAADAATGGTSVLIKVYDADEQRSSLQLHKLVTVVGVVVAGAAGGPPVVHALRVEGADVGDIHPALPPTAAATDAVSTSAAAAGRHAVVAHLAAALGGDTVAATYLAACLASRVCVRMEDAVLGKLSVNLVLPLVGGGGAGADVSYAGIADAIAAVVPRVVRLVADIPHLNAAPWYAVKDETVNRLRAGPLQAAPGGVLAVDATGLSAGILNATGIGNVDALSKVAVTATVPVKFFGLDSLIAVDAPLLVVSRGGKAIFTTDAVVHVRPTRGGGGVAAAAAPVDLPTVRRALALATVGDGELEISEEVSEVVSRTFVEARAAAAAARSRASGDSSGGGGGGAAAPVDKDTLGRWLGLARCLARFRGECVLTTELWEEALRLDRERLWRSKPEVLRGRGTPAHAVSQPLRQARAGST